MYPLSNQRAEYGNNAVTSRKAQLFCTWECILGAGPIHPAAQDDLQSVLVGGVGEFRGVVERLHCRLSELVHSSGGGLSER